MGSPRPVKGDVDGDDMDRRTSQAEVSLKMRLSRKRTKSGCLTCRKRRIKCGEERPVCRNCIKSKRMCEGYNQRVVFRPPTFEYRAVPHGGAQITFQAGPAPGPVTAHQMGFIHHAFDGGPPLQPRPPHAEFHEAHIPHRPQRSIPVEMRAGDEHPPILPETITGQPMLEPQYLHQPLHVDSGWSQATPATNNLGHHPSNLHAMPNLHALIPQQGMPPSDGSLPHPGSIDQSSIAPSHTQPYDDRLPSVSSSVRTASTYHSTLTMLPHDTPRTTHGMPLTPAWSQPAIPTLPDRGKVLYRAEYPNVQPPPPMQPVLASAPYDHITPEFYEQQLQIPSNYSPNTWLTQAAIEVQDDDYYDLPSDEDMEVDEAALAASDYACQGTLSGILRNNHISVQELQTRRYDTFLQNGILDQYRPEKAANPLRNPATARVFAHFVSATGPSLSIYERHPRNTSVLFTEGQVPLSQRGLWTYTMPMAALHNQGLLHAMLALASLHIARLTGASPTPSMQHYAWALKRVHHCVGHPKKRLEIATIAASLLLGFYEIISGDHMKWNTHLMGSKQLFVETDFAGMTQQFERMKRERAELRQYASGVDPGSSHDQRQDDILDQIPDVNERLVSSLVGREVRYGDHGQVVTPRTKLPMTLDLSKFEMLKDLYWWYCKQDTYQSLISGNPLLMDYSRWANCPPRAPLGRSDAVYGSFDHLILLLGRIADFAARDRARKLRQVEANGGQWRPAPGMNIPRLPQPSAPFPIPTPTTKSGPAPYGPMPQATQGVPPSPMPTFYGMAPPPAQNIRMPPSYETGSSFPTPRSASPKDTVDLQVATKAALDEHASIGEALRRFAASLGTAFDPLGPELQPIKNTAFGPAIHYRSFDIGCLWAAYHMAVIIVIRSHPYMPPAAHMAAGVAAQETAASANEIGRIVAGISVDSPDKPLNPTLGAVLTESCTPTFFAAVQYQDPGQRHETVTRVFDIARRTGWASAELIANGCETSWIRAAALGRGPPYERVVRNLRPPNSVDPRLTGSWERLDPREMPNEHDDDDRRHIRSKPQARLTWAIGIMGTETDNTPTL